MRMHEKSAVNCIVCDVTIRWAYRFVAHVDDRSRSASWRRWARIGMLSILYAPYARNRFSAVGITNEKDSHIVKIIFIDCSAMSASSVVMCVAVRCLRRCKSHGVSTVLHAVCATRKWIKKQNSMNLTWNQCANVATNDFRLNWKSECPIVWRSATWNSNECASRLVRRARINTQSLFLDSFIIFRSICLSCFFPNNVQCARCMESLWFHLWIGKHINIILLLALPINLLYKSRLLTTTSYIVRSASFQLYIFHRFT